MHTGVLHQPRIAWDAATMLVTAANADAELFGWFEAALAAVLGPSGRAQLAVTRDRLLRAERADVRSVEAGMWRVRLEEALRTRPDTAEALRELTLAARVRLAHLN
ncbi:hypothetical protein CS0771_52130 [Catellatospora sp. IY07-71]|uniref:hypothetical protein n=1 Tax=Catellatospora sp. IY07-71 TaxID=2728827 RepID=UPI001BB4141B|nr:hypothetical protein [Catellatospora sp. IY07-71]BCJ75669.1 hypothetical protein CS0771_52130 [Catellatospora sp. IY07-71]